MRKSTLKKIGIAMGIAWILCYFIGQALIIAEKKGRADMLREITAETHQYGPNRVESGEQAIKDFKEMYR